MNWTLPSLRARLVALVLSIIVPVAGVIGFLLVNDYRKGREQLEASTIATARALASAVDQRLAGVQDAMAVLATARSLQRGELSRFYEQALEVQALQGLLVIGLIDAELNPVLNTISPFGAVLRPAAATAHVKSVFVSGKPVISDLFRGSLRGSQTFAVGVPVRRDGSVAYTLVGGISPTSIVQLLERQKLPAGWLAAVVDRSGTIVARNAEQDRFVGRKARQQLLTRMSQVDEEAAEGMSLDNARVLTVFSRASLSGWAVIIGIPYDLLTEQLRYSLAALLAGTLALLAGGIALAWRFGEQLVGSVQDLKAAAALLGRRERVSAPRSAFAEANELGLALEQASRDLHDADADRVSNELRLSQAGSRLAGLVDSAMDAIITIDENQEIVLFNRAAEQIFGRARGDVLGQSLLLLMPVRFHQHHGALVHQFGQTGATARRMGGLTTLFGRRANGQEFPVEASISHLDTPEGKLFTVVVRDVTERVTAQDQLAAFSAKSSALREQEKRKIARELHDDLAQTMTVLKIELIVLRDGLPALTDAQSTRIARMVALLDAGVAATRRIAADLRPLLLDDLGLPAALEWLIENFSQRTGVECEFDMSEGFDLAEPHATEVFRIVQEALANVAKHARATLVFVQLELAGRVLTLRVQDNGRGFQPEAPRAPQSLGLAGLRERVGLLKGQMKITSAPGRGTTLKVQVPLEGGTP